MGLCLGIDWDPDPPVLPREPASPHEHDPSLEFHSDWGPAAELEHLRDCLSAHGTRGTGAPHGDRALRAHAEVAAWVAPDGGFLGQAYRACSGLVGWFGRCLGLGLGLDVRVRVHHRTREVGEDRRR